MKKKQTGDIKKTKKQERDRKETERPIDKET